MSTGAYEHRGGTAAHDPSFDHDDGVTPLEDEIGSDLEALQRMKHEFDAAQAAFISKMEEVFAVLLPPGSTISRFDRDWWGKVSTVRGNDRRAKHFEVVGKPRIADASVTHPELMRARFEAYPLNDKGIRMSGRPGNPTIYGNRDSDTVDILVCVNGRVDWDDTRNGNDILLETVRRAAIAKAGVAS